MSNCKYTEVVTPNTCLGDSLATFNNNFTKLDDALCLQPMIFSGRGIKLNYEFTEQNVNSVKISTNPYSIYSPFFEDYLNGATTGPLTLKDGTKINTTVFPIVNTSINKPAAVFSATSLSNSPPRVTIFWTASGADYTTIYATNSATRTATDMGTQGFNGSVNAILSTAEFIYVAGSFTRAGGYDFRKFCVIDVAAGSESNYVDDLGNFIEGDLGLVGQVIQKPIFDTRASTFKTHPLTDNGGFGIEGSVNALLQYKDLLIIGGSYKNVPGKNQGRGLTIWNSRTNRIYPFYVNGEVNALAIQDDILYLGGNFNFINYGPQSVSDISGQRMYTNGLAKISLSLIDSFANKSIIKSFSDNVLTTFQKHAVIHTIVATDAIYIGGDFKSYSEGKLVSSSLALLTPDGTLSNTWQPIIDGVVYKLLLDKNTLYAAGIIPYYLTAQGLENTPRTYDPYSNLICFDVTQSYYPSIVDSWRPIVNGPVMDMAVHNGTNGEEFIYCYGNFDQINGVNVTFLGAVPKNAGSVNNINEGQTPIDWQVHLDKPPQPNNKSLLRLDYSLIIGGNFSQINGHKRKFLGHLSGPYESLQQEVPYVVVWNLGAQLICGGGPIAMDFTQYTSVTANATDFGRMNKSSFPIEYTKEVFNGYAEGTLMRFFVQRDGTTENTGLSSDAYIIGWKLDFNQ